jgi:hypothetical protein
VEGAEIRDNYRYGADYALAIAFGAGGNASVLLNRVNASHNGNDGIWSYAEADDGVATIAIRNTVARDNLGDGVYSYLYSGKGPDTLFVERCQFVSNATYGIEIESDGASADLNLGDAAAGTAGFNSIFGNAHEAGNVGGGAVTAENNWWGTLTPAAGQFTGAVDYDPWLNAEP